MVNSTETNSTAWSSKRRLVFAIAIFFVSVAFIGVPNLDFISVFGFIGAGFVYVWKGEYRKIRHAVIAAAGMMASIIAVLLILISIAVVALVNLANMSVEYSFYSPGPEGANSPVGPTLVVVGGALAIVLMGAIGGFLGSIFRGQRFG